jgi:hypothetical protein
MVVNGKQQAQFLSLSLFDLLDITSMQNGSKHIRQELPATM